MSWKSDSLTNLEIATLEEFSYTNHGSYRQYLNRYIGIYLNSKERSINMAVQKHLQHPIISVIIPALNEAENLPFVLPNIPSIVDEVILVDGHSTDDTVAVAQQLLPTICVVKQVGKGKGDAVRAGFAASMGDIIVMMDADGSADPREIP